MNKSTIELSPGQDSFTPRRCSFWQRFGGVALGAVLFAAPARAQIPFDAPFSRVNGGVFDELFANSIVGAVGDFNNDGKPDLFVGNHTGGANWLFQGTGTGGFHRVVLDSINTDSPADPWSASWVDYDNDGWVDLFVASHNGVTPNRFYRNTGPNGFVRLTAAEIGPSADAASRALALSWADYDNDGHLDLFVANGIPGETTPDALYQNDGNGRFSKVTGTPLSSKPDYSFQGSWSDYDNDGDMDLLVLHTLGVPNVLFRNDGHVQFVDVTKASGLGDIGASMGASWGDFDNDGDLDLLVTNVALNQPVSPNFLYRNNGNGTFTRITTGTIAEDQDHFVSGAWMDCDNDGWLDLFVTVLGNNSPTPYNRLYHNQGDGTFAAATSGDLVTESGLFGSSAVADFDNDGFPDLFVTQGTIFASQSSALYLNVSLARGNQNNWIKVRCVGGPSNRSAIGAKIRLKARINGVERWQMRQIVGNEGAISFHSLDALFGLGDATVIGTLRVEWPSGRVQEFHEVTGKQTLTIVERIELSIAAPFSFPGNFEVTIKGPRLQRYRMEKSSDLKTWELAADGLMTLNEEGTVLFHYQPAPGEDRMYFRATPE